MTQPSICCHTRTIGSVTVEFFVDDCSIRRVVEAKICERCGAWRSIGDAADKIYPGEIAAARLIQSIELRIDRIRRSDSSAALLDSRTLARVAARSMNETGSWPRMTTGEMYGWGARDFYHGTDPWDAGWLAAAYFGYEPCADADANVSPISKARVELQMEGTI